MEHVPLIDLSAARAGGPDDRRRIAGLIDQACVEIGFFAVANHGVPESVCRDLRDTAHRFFEQPLAVKRRASPADERTPRGYHALGGEGR
jgi:isopenicillin N synthase-like dioxygenase